MHMHRARQRRREGVALRKKKEQEEREERRRKAEAERVVIFANRRRGGSPQVGIKANQEKPRGCHSLVLHAAVMDRIEIEFSSARRPAVVELTVCLCLCVMGALQRSQRALSPTNQVQAQAEAAAVKVGHIIKMCI
jgi:hypothetical protein